MKRIFAYVLASGIALLGCAPSIQDREEARSPGPIFDGAAAGLVVPPRTADDLIKVLDTALRVAGPKNPNEEPDGEIDRSRTISRSTTTPDSKPAANMQGAALAAFYIRRADAANRAGRFKQALSDFALAAELAESANSPRSALYFQFAGVAEAQFGTIARALQHFDKQESLGIKFGTDQHLSAVSHRIASLSNLGDLARAKEELIRLKHMVDIWNSETKSDFSKSFAELIKIKSEGVISSAEGNFSTFARQSTEAVTLASQMLAIARQKSGSRSTENTALLNRGTALRALSAARLELGQIVAAETAARDALADAIAAKGIISPEGVRSLLAVARALRLQGRMVDSEKIVEKLIGALSSGNIESSSSIYRSALMDSGVSLVLMGNYAAGFQRFEAADSSAAGDPTSRRRLHNTRSYAIAALETGRESIAILLSSAALESLPANRRPNLWQAVSLAVRAAAYLRLGRNADALSDALRASGPLTSNLGSATADDQGTQRHVIHQKAIAYVLEVLSTLPTDTGGGDIGSELAFSLADAGRNSAANEAVLTAQLRAGTGNAELDEALREFQETVLAERAMSTRLAQISELSQEDQRLTKPEALREQLNATITRKNSLADAIRARAPRLAELRSNREITREAAARSLRADEALLVYHVGPRQTLLWVVTADNPAARFHVIQRGEQAIARDIAQLNRAMTPGTSTISSLATYDIQAASRLYRELVEPAVAAAPKARTLVVVPSGPLVSLHFEALVTRSTRPRADIAQPFGEYRDVPFLILEKAIAYVPSVAALSKLREAPRSAASRFIAFGNPAFREEALAQRNSAGDFATRSLAGTLGLRSAGLEALTPLPDTEVEVLAVARAVGADPSREVFLGQRASVAAITSMDLRDRRIIMFATHGLLPGDIDGLIEPALALSSPKITGERRGDGLLRYSDIMRLRLDADWVILSACNTAGGASDAAESLSGLARAFFFAGARALLVSRWPVETRSAREFMVGMFGGPTSLSRAAMVQRAAITMIQTGGTSSYAYAHPFFWAPFTLVGDPG